MEVGFPTAVKVVEVPFPNPGHSVNEVRIEVVRDIKNHLTWFNITKSFKLTVIHQA